MSANDKDFKLSFEQLVKACKIMLYKINITTQKTNMKYDSAQQEVDKRLKASEDAVKSTSDEIKHFLHSVLSDFEAFQLRHREEHIALGKKLFKL